MNGESLYNLQQFQGLGLWSYGLGYWIIKLKLCLNESVTKNMARAILSLNPKVRVDDIGFEPI